MIEKVKLINDMDLGGVMIWSLETDDFKGNCGNKYPLLTAVNDALNGKMTGKPEKPVATTKIPTSESPVKPTTTQKVETTSKSTHDPNWYFVCPGVGYYPDPQSCDFYQCYQDGKGGIKAVKVSCPPGLCFNPGNNVCDWI